MERIGSKGGKGKDRGEGGEEKKGVEERREEGRDGERKRREKQKENQDPASKKTKAFPFTCKARHSPADIQRIM